MARPRTPLAKARATGRTVHDPQRYRNRKEPRSRPLGKPSKHLTEAEAEHWSGFKRELPWLMERDRAIVECACIMLNLVAKEKDPKAVAQLRLSLSAMGANPVDASKVTAPDEEEDSADAYLQ